MGSETTVLYQSGPDFSVVGSYYGSAKYEPTPSYYGELSVKLAVPFGDNFKALVDAIWARQVSNPVVVTHGSILSGLTMPIVAGGFSAGPCLQSLVWLVDYLEAVNYTGPASQSLLDMTKVATFMATWGITQPAAALGLATTCLRIRRSPTVCGSFHVRGCNIGADKESNLRPLLKLFNSNQVTAPTTDMFYVWVWVYVGNVDQWAQTHPPAGRRWRYKDPARPDMILDCEYLGLKSGSQAAVAKRDGIGKWAQVFHKRATNPGNGLFVVAGLYPSDRDAYYLAHEDGYVSYLAEVY